MVLLATTLVAYAPRVTTSCNPPLLKLDRCSLTVAVSFTKFFIPSPCSPLVRLVVVEREKYRPTSASTNQLDVAPSTAVPGAITIS
jgi:hypothetical protein